MADIDKDALVQDVLEQLLVVAAGEVASDADKTIVEKEIDRAWLRLSNNGVAPFDVDAIPDEAQTQMRDYVAFYCGPKFGVSGPRLGELKALSDDAKQQLAQQFEDTDLSEDEEPDTRPDYY